jgi:hypothetical protein
MSSVIIHPAPITQLSPIVTPFKITTLLPNQQCDPILTGATVYPWSFIFLVSSVNL